MEGKVRMPTNDMLREAAACAGVVVRGRDGEPVYGAAYSITRADVLQLHALCIKAINEDRAKDGFSKMCRMRMSKKLDITTHENGIVSSAFLYVNSDYFRQREAISFNSDGFIGFAGWAGDSAIEPFRNAFCEWLCLRIGLDTIAVGGSK